MKSTTKEDYHRRIVRTLVYIQDHLDEEVTLDCAAAVAAFSIYHFHRIFRALVGESFGEHVRRLRLERAAVHLKQKKAPVTDIAFAAGFDSHEAFTRAFRAMFGMPPSEYRVVQHYGEAMNYQLPDYGEPPAVEVKEVAPTRIVFLRHVGPYNEVGGTWTRLMSWAGMHGLLGPGMRMLGVVHDAPEITPPEKLRYDAAVAISRPVDAQGEFGVTELAGGRYAVVMHKGPYEQLSQTYHRLFGGWLPRSGEEVRDAPAYEEYLNSPQTAKPDDLLTRIWLPLK